MVSAYKRARSSISAVTFYVDDVAPSPLFVTAAAEAGLMFDIGLLNASVVINTTNMTSSQSSRALTSLRPPLRSTSAATTTISARDSQKFTSGTSDGVAATVDHMSTTSVAATRQGWEWFLDPLFRARLADLGGSARGPLAMRLGGGDQDCWVYNVTGTLTPVLPSQVPPYCALSHGGIKVLSREMWDAVVGALANSNISLVFGINSGVGRPCNGHEPGSWDPSTSGFDELVRYTYGESKDGATAAWAWELGNEPRAGKTHCGLAPTAAVLAADFARLRHLVRTAAVASPFSPRPPIVAGPDLQSSVPENFTAYRDFVNQATRSNVSGVTPLDATTQHFYPTSGRNSDASHLLLKPETLDYFSVAFAQYVNLTSPTWREAGGEVWNGETASLQNGGRAGVSDAWQSSTWLVDMLGQSGEVGVSRSLRECLICGHYNYLDLETAAPRPDFFTAILWHRVVGSRVLGIEPPHQGRTVRAYARCSARGDDTGRVTVAVVNLDTKDVSVTVALKSGRVSRAPQHVYLLTSAAYPQSTSIDALANATSARLNGVVLELVGSHPYSLPALDPVEAPAGSAVTMPPLSVALVDVDAAAAACMG